MRRLYVVAISLLVGCGDTPQKQVEKTPVAKKEVVKQAPLEAPVPRDVIQKQLQFKVPDNVINQEVLPDVEYTDDNLTVVAKGIGSGQVIPIDAIIDTPRNVAAASLVNRKQTIVWNPKWNFWNTGTISIPSLTLNFDKSILAIVESFGAERGPFGSRIVFMNTYNWQILAVHTFDDRKITDICYVSQNSLYCYAEAQPLLKQDSSLFRYNIQTRDMDDQRNVSISDMAYIKGKGLCVKLLDSTQFQLIPQHDEEKVMQFTTKNTKGKIINSLPGQIRLMGDKSIDYFSSNISWAQKSYPSNVDVIATQFIPRTKQTAFITSENQLMLQTKDASRVIASGTADTIFYDQLNHKLFVEKQFKNSLDVYSIPNMVLEETVLPGYARPATRGTILYINYLPHHEKYIYFDSYGNLYLLHKPKSRWMKILILEAKR